MGTDASSRVVLDATYCGLPETSEMRGRRWDEVPQNSVAREAICKGGISRGRAIRFRHFSVSPAECSAVIGVHRDWEAFSGHEAVVGCDEGFGRVTGY